MPGTFYSAGVGWLSEGERPGGQTKPFEFTAHPIRFALYLALFIACLRPPPVAGALGRARAADGGVAGNGAVRCQFAAPRRLGAACHVRGAVRVRGQHGARAAAARRAGRGGRWQRAAGGRRRQPGYQQRAAVLLSGFTDQWSALIVGTNLGGLGTLIASMASLITFKAVSVGRPGIRAHYLRTFNLGQHSF